MDVPEVDCSQATTMHGAGAAWIDVRETEEWDAAHIADTTHAPLADAIATITERWPDPSTPMVVSCLSGGRSGHAVAQLRARGYTDVHNLRGGIKAWVAEGRPVVEGA
jgi:rhodanese-related sulfurtransferase